MKLLKAFGLQHWRKAIGVFALVVAPMSWAAMGALVTLADLAPTSIYPSQTTTLRITLSNNSSQITAKGTAEGFANLARVGSSRGGWVCMADLGMPIWTAS